MSDIRYQHILDRNARYDGRFLTGVLTTGIYCLPSCTARKPKFENVRFFDDEVSAQAAGLRPCKRCRPDLFYRGMDIDAECYESLQDRLQADPTTFADVDALANAVGVSRTKLVDLCRAHGHSTPARLLNRARLAAAASRLLAQDAPVAEVGYAAGFDSEAAFHRQFLAHYHLTPGAYRQWQRTATCSLSLPPDYRYGDVLAYLGRDADGPGERRQGDALTKAVMLAGTPVRLTFRFAAHAVAVALAGESAMSPALASAAHHAALRCLGLAQGWEAPGKSLQSLAARRPGLPFPLTATVFEALVWAIVGQQVNLRFAAQLRRTVIQLAGTPAGDGMLAHPTPADVAGLDPADLTQHQFSQSKARYLVDTAQALLARDWDIESLPRQSVPQALRRLLAMRGIGPWTAQYILLRGGGFADCVPVGDAGLTAALQRLHLLPSRPDAKATQDLMARYAPQRSLATAYLWDSLKDHA